ncbi:MAG: tetratricopeptide repeat protein, partial [Thermoanaerobaculia bacterium]
MKFLGASTVCILLAAGALAQAPDAAAAKPAALLPGLAPIHHPIATSVPEAQKFFDQGLSLVYAFNHEEAIRSFERAAE